MRQARSDGRDESEAAVFRTARQGAAELRLRMEAGMGAGTSRKRRICRTFGSGENIEGQLKRTGKVVSVPVGEGMIGRVVNALGQPIGGAGPITCSRVPSD